MIYSTSKAPGIASEQAYVVYDVRTGHIRHVHRVTVFEGASAPSQKEGEARAMSTAQQSGHPIEHLRVLAVELGDLHASVPQRVDLQTLRLVIADSSLSK
jgi:hypothetical protein